MDLRLPPTAPQLGKYNRYNWDLSSFAIYTLIKTSEQSLQKIASQLEEEWWEEHKDEETHLVRVAPDHDFEGGSLKDVIQAHISLLEHHVQGVKPYDNHSCSYNDGDLDWFPIAFIVLVSDDIGKTGLLFVFADPYDEVDTECPLDVFHFRVGDAHGMLSGIRLGHALCTDSKEIYATGDTNAA